MPELTPRERYKECYRMARMYGDRPVPLSILRDDIVMLAAQAQSHYWNRKHSLKGWSNIYRWNQWLSRRWDYKYSHHARELKYA